MIQYDLLLVLGAKTLLLSFAALLVGTALRLSRCQSPKIHRCAWLVVLAIGILGFGIPVRVPVVQQIDLVETSTINEAIDMVPTTPVTFRDENVVPAVLPPQIVLPPQDMAEVPVPEEKIPVTNEPFPVPVVTAEANITAETETAIVTQETAQEIATVPLAAKVSVRETLFRVACFIWLIGMTVIFVWRLAMQWILLRRLRSAVLAKGIHRIEWETLLAEYRISPEKLPLLLTDGLGPGLVWRPGGMAVVVPRELWEDTLPELHEGMLRHELAHYRNRDMLRLNLARLCASVHWFNPFAWWAVGKLDEAAEWLCDIAAFGFQSNGTANFAESMVAVHETSQSIVLNRITFGGGGIQQRLEKLQAFIEKQGDSKMKKFMICLFLCVVAACGLCRIQFVSAQVEEPNPNEGRMELRFLASEDFPQDRTIIELARKTKGDDVKDEKGQITARWVSVRVDAYFPVFRKQYQALVSRGETEETFQVLALIDPYNISGKYLKEAKLEENDNQSFFILFTLDQTGKNLLGAMTSNEDIVLANEAGQPRRMAVIIDGIVWCTPTIEKPIHSDFNVTMVPKPVTSFDEKVRKEKQREWKNELTELVKKINNAVYDEEEPVATQNPDTSAREMKITLVGQNCEATSNGYIRAYPNPKPDDWDEMPKNFPLENGQCVIPFSNFGQLQSLKLIFYADGFAPYEMAWPVPQSEPIPTEYEHALEPAAERIGGIVLDSQGNPVEGATVEFAVDLHRRQRHPDGIITRYAQWLKTDAEGRWTYAVLPTDQMTQVFDMVIEHPKLPRLRIHEGQTFRDYTQKDEQGRFSKTVTLPNGMSLKGHVLDLQGNPVEGAMVYTDAVRPESGRFVKTLTDAKGEFVFENCSPKGDLNSIDLGVWHANFAPILTSLGQITEEMPPQELQFESTGRKIIFRAVDENGDPIEDIHIVPRRWKNKNSNIFVVFNNGDPWIDYAKTDKDGMFVWSNAPNEDFQLEISGKNYQNLQFQANELKYDDKENVLVFKSLIEVTGKVTDAETGELIPNFEVTEWLGFKNSSGALSRELSNQKGNNGTFHKTVGRRMGELDRYHLRVDAEGYEGMLSEAISPDLKKVTLNFALTKGGLKSNTLSGVVLLPNGEPAERVTIGVSIPGRPIQTQLGHLLHQGFDNQYFTDAQGNFSISRSRASIHADEDYLLLFLHDAGTFCMRKEQFEQHTGPIQLEAWGRIEGTICVGDKPGENLLFMYSNDLKKHHHRPGIASIDYFHTATSDANGRYVIERVFPGRGRVSRGIKYNNHSTTAPFRTRTFEIKPGETLTMDLGGGGSIANGQIYMNILERPAKAKDVDWNFMHVTAVRTVPELALPQEYREAYWQFFSEPLADPRLNDGWVRNPYEVEEIINAWLESPAGQAAMKDKPEQYEKAKHAMALILERDKKQEDADLNRVIATVEGPGHPEAANGRFVLDGITPGDWKLGVEMNWPSVPGQYWDYLETWKTQAEFTVPEIPTEEPLLIFPVILGPEHAVKSRR